MRMIVQCSMLKNTNIKTSDLSVCWWGEANAWSRCTITYYYEIRESLCGKTLRMLFETSYPNQNRFKCHNFQANQTFSQLLIAFHTVWDCCMLNILLTSQITAAVTRHQFVHLNRLNLIDLILCVILWIFKHSINLIWLMYILYRTLHRVHSAHRLMLAYLYWCVFMYTWCSCLSVYPLVSFFFQCNHLTNTVIEITPIWWTANFLRKFWWNRIESNSIESICTDGFYDFRQTVHLFAQWIGHNDQCFPWNSHTLIKYRCDCECWKVIVWDSCNTQIHLDVSQHIQRNEHRMGTKSCFILPNGRDGWTYGRTKGRIESKRKSEWARDWWSKHIFYWMWMWGCLWKPIVHSGKQTNGDRERDESVCVCLWITAPHVLRIRIMFINDLVL